MRYIKTKVTREMLEKIKRALWIGMHPLSLEPVCDFCLSAKPIWIFASHQMSTGEQQECWRWMACEDCTRDIETHNWTELAKRVVQLLILRGVDEMVAKVAVQISLESFHKNVIKAP